MSSTPCNSHDLLLLCYSSEKFSPAHLDSRAFHLSKVHFHLKALPAIVRRMDIGNMENTKTKGIAMNTQRIPFQFQPFQASRPMRWGRALITTSLALLCGLGGTSLLAANAPQLSRPLWRELQRGDPGRPSSRFAPAPAPEYRTYDGQGNNRANSQWGAAQTGYLREGSGSHYSDGLATPAGADRPSARLISNFLAAQGDFSTEDERGLSTAIYEFGQFLDHDIGLAKGGDSEAFDILVPAGDPYFDPAGSGSMLIYLDRSAYDPNTGTSKPREQINTVTAFIDASHIYGSDASRAAWLRTFSGGLLKERVTAAGRMLPFNDGTMANDNPLRLAANTLSVAGDVRANEQPGLTTLHIVFLREHNYHAARLAALHRDWNDERLYQEARRIVGAEMQVITVNEFLPALLGHGLPPYRGYNSRVNPGIGNTFATAAYRFGHSQVGPDIGVINEAFEEVANLELADIFFNPNVIPAIGGIDPIVRYMALDHAQRVDTLVVDPLRNFLFGAPGQGGFDLAALNIQRGRDHGLGSYNDVRADFRLRRVTSFEQITRNADVAAALKWVYGDVNRIDAWVGILAEDHLPGSSVGPTADAVITDQFRAAARWRPVLVPERPVRSTGTGRNRIHHARQNPATQHGYRQDCKTRSSLRNDTCRP